MRSIGRRGLVWLHRLIDALKVKPGVNFSARHLRFNAIQGPLMDEITSVNVPVYFFTGRFDYTNPVPCTEEYFQQLVAPSKKPCLVRSFRALRLLEEPDRFAEEMRRVTRETSRN